MKKCQPLNFRSFFTILTLTSSHSYVTKPHQDLPREDRDPVPESAITINPPRSPTRRHPQAPVES